MGGDAPTTGPDTVAEDVLPLEPAGALSLRQWPAMFLAMAVFASFSLLAAWKSPGFLEADACTHYLYARFGLAEHHLLTNFWGRPFCTLAYTIPATLAGRMGVRVTSLLMALTIGLICYRIARNLGFRWPGLALIFLLGQPLVFLHSFSELTELPFALLVALALWAYQARQFLLMALIVGIMPAARPEGLGFIALAAVALLLHRRPWWIPVLGVWLTAWSFWGWLQFGSPQPWFTKGFGWLIDQWPYAAESLYDKGPLLLFKRQPNGEIATSLLMRLPALISPLVFPAMILGAGLILRPRTGKGFIRSNLSAIFGPDHGARVRWLIAAVPLAVLVIHSVLYWRGKMSSNGELRYLMVAAPMWALLCAWGWEWVFNRLDWRSPLGWAGIAVLVPALVNGLYPVVPIKLSKEGMRAQIVEQWVRFSPYLRAYPRLTASATDIYYSMDLSGSDKKRAAEWYRPTITGETDRWGVTPDRRGILLIWDPIYGVYNSDPVRSITAQEIAKAGWIPIHIFNEKPWQPPRESKIDKLAEKIDKDELGDWIVFLSPQDKDGNPTPVSLAVPLPDNLPAPRPGTQPTGTDRK